MQPPRNGSAASIAKLLTNSRGEHGGGLTLALRPIGQDELDNFQFDESGRLHWNGEAVLLEKRIRLETYQIVLASVATAGSLLSGIHPFGHSFGWW
jgi:hypothetical protein